MIRNVVEYLEEIVCKYPNKIALTDENRKITFSQVREEALKVAYKIKLECGEVKNQAIAVYMKKSVECIVSFIGIAYSGNFYCPIDFNSPKERIKKIIKTLNPMVVVCNDDKQMDSLNIEKIISYPDVLKIEEWCEVYNYKNVLDIDPLYVLFTSGSTGQPKGVTISHKGVIDYIEWLYKTFEFNETTIFGNQAPFYFDNSILDIYSTLKTGATMVIIPEKLFAFPNSLIEYLNNHEINTIFWVPSALISVANSGMLEKRSFVTLKKVLFCGEVMPNKQLNIWRKTYPNAIYANLYGPTEITDVCTYYIVEREFQDEEPLPIGKACQNTEILILDENDKLVRENEIGELCVRGTGLSMGYYGDEEKTNKVFVQNPLNTKYKDLIYRTGDLVKYNEKGEIVYVGRKDFQIKHQGHRIELGEIESAVSAMNEIQQNCALYDDIMKKIILVCVTNGKIGEKEIYRNLQQKIPKYMMPSIIKIIDTMPLNVNGKIDRTKLKKEIVYNECM